MKQVVITWGFSNSDGKPELDCYLEITDAKHDGMAIKMMDLRSRFNSSNKMALFQVDDEFTRETMEDYIKTNTPCALELLKKASVRAGDITRKGYDHQAIDFIMS